VVYRCDCLAANDSVLFPEGQMRIWLYTAPTDMRKSYTGLSTLVRNELKDNPLSGDVFVFVNRRRNLMKALYFDRTGYAIWSKKLAQGQFVYRSGDKSKQALSLSELRCLVDGIEIGNAKRYRRFALPAQV